MKILNNFRIVFIFKTQENFSWVLLIILHIVSKFLLVPIKE
ncbi:MAG: hypothetical protein K0S34_427 [Bacillales bacterium]|jgi:hypothetical protein|nr:hypothetical protein [Bacillales bacterium]